MTTSSNTIVAGVSYNPANQLLGMTFNGVTETRGYNWLNQLVSLSNTLAAYPYTAYENLTYNCAHNFGCEIGVASKEGLLPSGNPCNQPITFSAQHLTTLQEIENYAYQVAYGMVWGGLAGPDENPYNFEPISFFGLVSNPQSAVSSQVISYTFGN